MYIFLYKEIKKTKGRKGEKRNMEKNKEGEHKVIVKRLKMTIEIKNI